MSPPTRATNTSALNSRPIRNPTTVAISPPNTTRAMTGTATHFTHHGSPAKISRIALVLLVSCLVCVLHSMLGPPRGPTGASQPLSSPESSLREPQGRRSRLGRREDDEDPQVLADVVELVRDSGRDVHDAAPCHLGCLHTDGDRRPAADDEVHLVLVVRLLRIVLARVEGVQ